MTEPGDEFETFLKTRTVLPDGMSDDDKVEPPKALDAIVLKEAREAIRARQRLNQAPRWATPVALAATILLCLSIVLNVSLNTNRPAAGLRRMTAATADKPSPTPASPASEGERREEVADGASHNEAILPEAKVAEPRAPRPPVVAAAATPGPVESSRANGSAADKADAFANRSGTPAQAVNEATSATDSGDGKPAQLADRRRTPTQGPSEATSASSAADHSRTPAQAQSEAQPAPNSATDSVVTLAARGYAGTAAARAPATATRELAAAPSPAAETAAAPSPAAAPPHPQDPKAWLQHIAALRAEGKTAQADAEMQRFRATFPAYPAKPAPPAPSEPPK